MHEGPLKFLMTDTPFNYKEGSRILQAVVRKHAALLLHARAFDPLMTWI